MNLPSRRHRREALIPIDSGYLEAQVPELAGTDRHLAHYLRHGLSDQLDPTPFFSTDWYAWQNPDWSAAFDAPYLHYLNVGRAEGRDPSPLVDIVRYRECLGSALKPEEFYDAILSGVRSPALGVCEGVCDLEACQKKFLQGIAVLASRRHLNRPKSRALVMCQMGRAGEPDAWLGAQGREWDLLVNYYDAAGFRPGIGDYVFYQKGTKFTAMALLWQRFPEIFADYEHVLFIDDDIETTTGDLNALFTACRRHDLDLAQMALTGTSSCNWTELFARPGRQGPRAISAVEIMMPVFSQRALSWIAPTFGQSISGFGLDLVWGHLVARQGGKVAVLDDVAATHARAVDHSGGAYYEYLRRHGINPKAELWHLIKRHGAARDIRSD